MNKKGLPPSMKIRNEINEIMNGMKEGHHFYDDPISALMIKAKELVIQEMLEGEVTDYLG